MRCLGWRLGPGLPHAKAHSLLLQDVGCKMPIANSYMPCSLRMGRRAQLRHASLCVSAATLLAACFLDSSPIKNPPATALDSSDTQVGGLGGLTNAQVGVGERAAEAPVAGAGSRVQGVQTATAGSQADRMETGDDAGVPDTQDVADDSSTGVVDAGAPDSGRPDGPDGPSGPKTAPTDPTTSETEALTSCSRETLTQRARAYFDALAAGDASSLTLHPSARYTENGREQQLGLGLWLSRPSVEFARTAIDEQRCSTLTEAVLSSLADRPIVAVRLLYLAEQLLEIEAQVVSLSANASDPDAVIPPGFDSWTDPVPEGSRLSRGQLVELAEQYFDAAAGATPVPASAPGCKRRQNGVPMQDNGSCAVAPGSERFKERRYSVVDVTAGIVTSSTVYNNYIGFYLIKVADGRLQNIEVVGGARSSTTGW